MGNDLTWNIIAIIDTIILCQELAWGPPPMAKVMRKKAQHMQRQDRASGVPLEILKHLPQSTVAMQNNCPWRNPCELLSPLRPPFYCHLWANQRSGELLLSRKSSRFLHKLLRGGSIPSGGDTKCKDTWNSAATDKRISRALLFCRVLYSNALLSQIQQLCTTNYYDSHFAHSYTAGWGRGGHRSGKGWRWHMA